MQILAPIAQLERDILAYVLSSFNYQALRLKGKNISKENSRFFLYIFFQEKTTLRKSLKLLILREYLIFVQKDQFSSSKSFSSLPPRSSSCISHISSFLAFSLSPLYPTSSSSRNYSRQDKTSFKKSYYSNSYMYLGLDSRSRSSFLAIFLTSLFLPFLYTL